VRNFRVGVTRRFEVAVPQRIGAGRFRGVNTAVCRTVLDRDDDQLPRGASFGEEQVRACITHANRPPFHATE
jgi:hypothetical protein